MLTASLIAKKRDHGALTPEEISYLIRGFTTDEVKDYQMAALAMAICLQGMNPDEVTALTKAMLDSGERLPRVPDGPPRVDKHSSGGLGDKVSLILAPLLAAAGLHVPMISGRGLGLTGGTLDKLEAIPGFEVNFESKETPKLLREAGCFIISASDQIAPADRRLYALRDVTATVESVGLITASILSKKLAASLDALVMDVKVGCGAFMKTDDQALQLARSLVSTGASAGLPVTALLTDMDQPLGRAVGNAIEVNESVDVLKGQGPPEVRELTIELSARVLQQVAPSEELTDIRLRLGRLLDSGAAMETFQRMVAAQHGKLAAPLPLAAPHVIIASEAGYIHSIDCFELGQTVVALGGGRRVKDDKIAHDVGLSVDVRIGDIVEKGQPIATLFASKEQSQRYLGTLQTAFKIATEKVAAKPLIRHTIPLLF